jgi:hypothetical protein
MELYPAPLEPFPNSPPNGPVRRNPLEGRTVPEVLADASRFMDEQDRRAGMPVIKPQRQRVGLWQWLRTRWRRR